MPSKTSNYQLNQWVPEDNFLRTDFNEDNAKIDEALTGLQEQVTEGKTYVVTGSYVGDGTDLRTIELGFRPAVVFVAQPNTNFTHNIYGNSTNEGLTLVENGFTVMAARSRNTVDVTYYYAAIG